MKIPAKLPDRYRVTWWQLSTTGNDLIQYRATYYVKATAAAVFAGDRTMANALPFVDEWLIEHRYLDADRSDSEWRALGRNTTQHMVEMFQALPASASPVSSPIYETLDDAYAAAIEHTRKQLTRHQREADRCNARLQNYEARRELARVARARAVRGEALK